MQQNMFEVWLCVEGHTCSRPNGNWFCWVVDESIAFPDERAPDQYVAWGYNSDLRLFEKRPLPSSQKQGSVVKETRSSFWNDPYL